MLLYLRFTLSYRDVEELLAERGLDVSYESVRSWVLKFGPTIARRLRQVRPRPSDRWHLDEMVVQIAGKRMYLWRAVDHEGEILDVLVQRRRDRRAAVKLMRKLMRKQGFAPKRVVTDKLRAHPVAGHPAGRSYWYGARTKPTLVADRKFELLALRRGQAPTTSELIFDRIAALHQEDRVTFAPGEAARRRSAQIMRTWLYARD